MASQEEEEGEPKRRLSLSRKRKRTLQKNENEDKNSSTSFSVVYETHNKSKYTGLGSNSSTPLVISSDSDQEEEQKGSKRLNSSLPSLSSLKLSPADSDYTPFSPSTHLISLLCSPVIEPATKKKPARKKKKDSIDQAQTKLDKFFAMPSNKTNVHLTEDKTFGSLNGINSLVHYSIPKRHVKKQFKSREPSQIHSRKCPAYKWIPDTSITVDAFSYGDIDGCNAYFLTHFHSDHYTGLNSRFKHRIYCSRVTGNLIIQELKVRSDIVYPLPVEEERMISGVQVTLLDANHCPGSVMILFKLPNGKSVLHTGDFRANRSITDHALLQATPIDTLFLDTTYCSPRYDFPPQEDVVSFVVGVALERLSKDPKTLIVCGAYTIGKERIYTGIAQSLGSQCYVSKGRYKVLQCLESKEILSLVNSHSPLTSPVHVMPLNKMNLKELGEYLKGYSTHFSSILAFKPTGWTTTAKCNSLSNIRPVVRGVVTVYGVPYSEHSSVSELKDFVQNLNPRKIVSTVGGANARETAESRCYRWLQERFHDNSSAPKRVPVQLTLDNFARVDYKVKRYM